MQRFTSIVLLVAFVTLCSATNAQDLKPGLVGEYFKAEAKLDDKGKTESDVKPFLVRIDKQVNYKEVNGEFYGSKLSDQFAVRWSGSLQIDQPGKYAFATASDDGSMVYIDDKLVVGNWGAHSWTKKSGEVELNKGSHKLRVLFNEGGGGSGCVFYWTRPGGKEEPVPANVLSHDPKSAEIEWDQVAWNKAKSGPSRPKGGAGAPYNEKLYGPGLGLPMRFDEDEYDVYRGILVRLDKAGDACMLFDADTLRMAAGWTDGGLTLNGLPFTGGHGIVPGLSGEAVFKTVNAPGWSHNDSLKEPRTGEGTPPLGPLPREWAKFKGWYLHGDSVVLSYSVGGAAVLESPRLIKTDDQKTLCRSLQIEGDDMPMQLVLSDAKGDATADGLSASSPETHIRVVGAPESSSIKAENEKFVLTLPAFKGIKRFQILLGTDSVANVDAGMALDLTPLTKGGPARWTDGPIVTKGEIAKETEQPYVLDRLTLPQSPYGGQMRVGGFDFFPDGKSAAFSTWSGEVWIVSGIDESLEKLTWKKFAAGLHEPLGLKIVDGKIYTVSDDQITRYHDFNNDGEADFYETFSNDWDLTSGFHAFCFDLHTDQAGNFYFAFGSPVRGGGRSFERMGRHHGSIMRVSKDGSKLERYATGLRAPNGMCVSPDGRVTCGDNEGTFVPRCPIHWIDQGEFLGVVDSSADYATMKTTPTVDDRRGDRPQNLDVSEMPMPLAWLPKDVDNSNGGQAWVTSDKWGPLQGEMLHMSYGQSSLYLVLKEKKGELMQGGVVKFPLRFSSSAMRARFNPDDGQLYVTGLRGWQTNAAKNGGIDRVRYTGKKVYMPVGLKAKKNGIEITFSQPLNKELAADPDSYAVQAADIRWTQDYGSSEYKIGARDKKTAPKGWTEMFVNDAKLLADGKTVFIEIEDMQPVHEMKIDIDIEAADGTAIRTKISNTVHVTE